MQVLVLTTGFWPTQVFSFFLLSFPSLFYLGSFLFLNSLQQNVYYQEKQIIVVLFFRNFIFHNTTEGA